MMSRLFKNYSALIIEIATVIFAAGMIYYKVDSVDLRVRRIENIFDSIIEQRLIEREVKK